MLTAGQADQLRFELIDPNQTVETALTINVPEGAKVTLAGNTTKTAGTVRTYRTKELRRGESWDNYVVQVELNGVVKEQPIRLIGGDEIALNFNFDEAQTEDAAKLASR